MGVGGRGLPQDPTSQNSEGHQVINRLLGESWQLAVGRFSKYIHSAGRSAGRFSWMLDVFQNTFTLPEPRPVSACSLSIHLPLHCLTAKYVFTIISLTYRMPS